jgi:hypothetical protein
MKPSTHENFSREEPVAPGSDRSFGLLIGTVLGILASLNAWRDGHSWQLIAPFSIYFLGAAAIYPSILRPFNRIWLRFGLLLHKVVNPMVMGLLFFGAVLPTGLILRARGKDLLRLKLDPETGTYWIVRRPPGPSPETIKNQF